jgi:glutathione S-transferase
VSGIAREKIFRPRFGQATDEKRVEELVAQLEGKLDGYEAILGKQKYLAGDVRSSFGTCPPPFPWVCWDLTRLQEVTLADLYHLPYGTMVIDQLGYGSLEKRPNVQR